MCLFNYVHVVPGIVASLWMWCLKVSVLLNVCLFIKQAYHIHRKWSWHTLSSGKRDTKSAKVCLCLVLTNFQLSCHEPVVAIVHHWTSLLVVLVLELWYFLHTVLSVLLMPLSHLLLLISLSLSLKPLLAFVPQTLNSQLLKTRATMVSKTWSKLKEAQLLRFLEKHIRDDLAVTKCVILPLFLHSSPSLSLSFFPEHNSHYWFACNKMLTGLLPKVTTWLTAWLLSMRSFTSLQGWEKAMGNWLWAASV